jgi:type I restriction enzyme S subunit
VTRTVPEGWSLATVGELAEYVNGVAFKPTDWGTEGRPIIRIQNLTDPTRRYNFTTREVPDRVVVRFGDILVSWSATLDAFVWRGSEAVLNQHIFRVLPGSRVQDSRLLLWTLKEAIAELSRGQHAHGSTMQHVNRGPFLAHQVAIPPDHQQKAIADEIEAHMSRVDATASTLDRARRNLKRYRESVLKSAVEGRLVPAEAAHAQTPANSFEPASVLLERIGSDRRKTNRARVDIASPTLDRPPVLPGGWCWSTIDEIALDVTYGSSSRASSEVAGGVPVLRMGNVVDGRLDWTSLKYLPSDHAEFPKLLLKPGDLLFNRTNSAELVGKCAVFQGAPHAVSFASYLIRVRFADGIVPSFIAAYINSNAGRSWIAAVASQQVGQANVNGTKLKQLRVPIPPIAEQIRIVDEMSRLLTIAEATEMSISRDRAHLKSLQAAILRSAFDGELE